MHLIQLVLLRILRLVKRMVLLVGDARLRQASRYGRLGSPECRFRHLAEVSAELIQ